MDTGSCSPDEAKRNPGLAQGLFGRSPDCAALHPGYACLPENARGWEISRASGQARW